VKLLLQYYWLRTQQPCCSQASATGAGQFTVVPASHLLVLYSCVLSLVPIKHTDKCIYYK